MINQINQLANLIALSLLRLGHALIQRHNEIFDQAAHGQLALIDLRVDLRTQLDQECYEAREIEFVESWVGSRPSCRNGASSF